MADEHVSDAITESVNREIGGDVSIYLRGGPAPLLLPHTWPFDDGEAERLRVSPSQRSKLVRSAFTEALPAGLTAQEHHDAWHRFQVDHPNIWPACHGALANRVEEMMFFRDWEDRRSSHVPDLD